MKCLPLQAYITSHRGIGAGGTDVSVKWFGLKQLCKWSKCWTAEFIPFQRITENPCINSSDIQVPIESNSWTNSKQIWGCRAGTCYQLCLFFPANAGSLSANLHLTAARVWTAEKKLSCSSMHCLLMLWKENKLNSQNSLLQLRLLYKTIMKDLTWKTNKWINVKAWNQSSKHKGVNFSFLRVFDKRE